MKPIRAWDFAGTPEGKRRTLPWPAEQMEYNSWNCWLRPEPHIQERKHTQVLMQPGGHRTREPCHGKGEMLETRTGGVAGGS